jgi:primosomal protein N' (replication factor Y)
MDTAVLRIALPAPLDTLFDYLPPPGVEAADLPAGIRVRVPFGRGLRIGLLAAVGNASEVPKGRLRAVERLLDCDPLLDADHLGFLAWAAGYYHHPIGEVLLAALPARLRAGEPPLATSERGWTLTDAGRMAIEQISPRRAPRQAAILAALGAAEDPISDSRLLLEPGDVRAALRALRDKGWVRECELEPRPAPARDVTAGSAAASLQLNPAQRDAVATIRESLGRFDVHLLEGVTGSGKTEVYLRAARTALARGAAVLVLVPEIALTPQLLRRFQRGLDAEIGVLHSGLGDREREQVWQRARLGGLGVLLGTRSAVLGPIARLGLVIVDEEHDGSLKQQDGFRYSARDLAIARAQRAGCPVVLGSATPSLESLQNAISGRYRLLDLPQRAGEAAAPRLDLLDIRGQPLEAGVSPVLLHELESALAAGHQALMFLNRRGFAPVLACFACGWLSDCPRCDARQTLHKASGLLWCHHCGHQQPQPRACPTCGEADLQPLGQGTERLEQMLQRRFAEVPLIRVDRDATRRKGSLDRLLAPVLAGEPALLVGTQMLAKGHHFPGVTLVGVIDADGGLFSADFRSPERMAQLLIQVAGRAGRGAHPGRVLIQTRFPEHPLLQTLVRGGYPSFARAALAERRQAGLPPYSHQVLVRAEAVQETLARELLEQLREQALQLLTGDSGVAVWGPVPAPMERRAGRYRAHLLLQSPRRMPLHALLRRLLPALAKMKSARRSRWSVDVDPLDLY